MAKTLLNIDIKIELPYYLIRTLSGYEDAGVINSIESYIIDSIEKFVEHYSANLIKGDIGITHNTHTFSVNLKMPLTLYMKLYSLSLKIDVPISAIITEALGHYIPLLLAQRELIEDYALELVEEI